MSQIDVNHDKVITRQELDAYLRQLPPSTINLIYKSIREDNEALRDRVIQTVFEALDKNGDATVDKAEVMDWLKNESAWKNTAHKAAGSEYLQEHDTGYGLTDAGMKHIFEQMDADLDGFVTMTEMKKFFRGWNIRDLRIFTQDALYERTLQKLHDAYVKDPSPEIRERIKQLKKDRDYVTKVYRAEDRRSNKSTSVSVSRSKGD